MKVESLLDKIIVYIYLDKYINKSIKDMIKKVIKDLNRFYNIKIIGSYDLKLYLNKNYGMILEIKKNNNIVKEDTININLKILKNSLVLYEVDDPLDYIDNEIYFYNNKFYINLKAKNINIMENANIVYSVDAYKVIGRGIKIN